MIFPGLDDDIDSEDDLTIVALPDQPCTQEGLLCDVQSGGSIIDFDYSRKKDVPSVRTSVSLDLLLHCHKLLIVDFL